MTESPGPEPARTALVVYYSPAARHRLESALRARRWGAYAIDGRARDAVDEVRAHPAPLVLIDSGADDINVRQAVRHIGQLVPNGLVISVGADCREVEVHRGSHQEAAPESLEAALELYAGEIEAKEH